MRLAPVFFTSSFSLSKLFSMALGGTAIPSFLKWVILPKWRSPINNVCVSSQKMALCVSKIKWFPLISICITILFDHFLDAVVQLFR